MKSLSLLAGRTVIPSSFQTRKIVGAVIQHITYNEFLPRILGVDTLNKYKLVLKKTGFDDPYDANINPAIANVFSTAALR